MSSIMKANRIKVHPVQTYKSGKYVYEKTNDEECVVRGALVLTLRVARMAGMAPVRLMSEGDGCHVSYSPPSTVYSYALNCLLVAVLATAIIRENSLPNALSAQSFTMSARFMFNLATVLNLIAAAVFAANGPPRIKKMIQFMNIRNSVLNNLGRKSTKRPSSKGSVAALVIIVVNVFMNVIDFWKKYVKILEEGRNVESLYLYISNYVATGVVLVVELQFALIALATDNALKCIAEELETHRDNPTVAFGSKISKRKQVAIYDLGNAYAAMCDVMNEVNSAFAFEVTLLSSQFFVKLIVSAYLFQSYLRDPNEVVVTYVLRIIDFSWSCLTFLMIVEPGHRIQNQLKSIQKLVNSVLRRLEPHDYRVNDLMFFFKQISMNLHSLSVMGVETIARPFILTMFGGITNYIVIMLNFVTLDDKQ